MRWVVWLGLGILAAGMLVWEGLPRTMPRVSGSMVPASRIIATLWHLKMAKERLHDPPRLSAMSIAEVMALPTFPRYLTFAQLVEISALEDRGVTLTGFVARVRHANDGDYHVHLTEVPVGRCLRHNTPSQLVTELTPAIQARKPAYTLVKLETLCGTETRLRVSGWLLYDATHEARRGTPWEVHPVTRIEVCCWKELS